MLGPNYLNEGCRVLGTCLKSVAGFLGHVAEADGDAVSTARLQSLKSVLHCVVRSGDFIIALCLPNCVPQMHNICLHTATHPDMMTQHANVQTAFVFVKIDRGILTERRIGVLTRAELGESYGGCHFSVACVLSTWTLCRLRGGSLSLGIIFTTAKSDGGPRYGEITRTCDTNTTQHLCTYDMLFQACLNSEVS